jgi:hypothetical protein
MSDDSVTGQWPGVSRDGERPELRRGPIPGAVKRQNEYLIRTTPVPGGTDRYDWVQFFNSHLSNGPITGYHDGNKIIVECSPDDEPQLIEKVDSAIQYANQRLKELQS